MVRSKSESDPDERELFHLVERFRSDEKYFDISRAEIERELEAGGYCEIYSLHEVADDDGEPIGAQLRLNIACKSSVQTCWQMALKLHTIRIDGIDFETKFLGLAGTKSTGWHRHGWDAARRSAESVKVPLSGFSEGLSSREDFLIRAFQELRIRLNSSDHGHPSLPFA